MKRRSLNLLTPRSRTLSSIKYRILCEPLDTVRLLNSGRSDFKRLLKHCIKFFFFFRQPEYFLKFIIIKKRSILDKKKCRRVELIPKIVRTTESQSE